LTDRCKSHAGGDDIIKVNIETQVVGLSHLRTRYLNRDLVSIRFWHSQISDVSKRETGSRFASLWPPSWKIVM